MLTFTKEKLTELLVEANAEYSQIKTDIEELEAKSTEIDETLRNYRINRNDLGKLITQLENLHRNVG